MAAGPRSNHTAVLPDGRLVTPVGKTITVDLLPLAAVMSHDGKRLYVSSEGGDDSPTHDKTYNRFISVVDTATMSVKRVQDDALQYGIAETPTARRSTSARASQGRSASSTSRAPPWSSGEGLPRSGGLPLGTGRCPRRTPHLRRRLPWQLAVGHRHHDPRPRRARQDRSVPLRGRHLARRQAGLRLQLGPVQPTADDVQSNLGGPVDTPPLTIGGYNTDGSSSVWFYDLTNPATPVVTAKVRVGPDLDGVRRHLGQPSLELWPCHPMPRPSPSPRPMPTRCSCSTHRPVRWCAPSTCACSVPTGRLVRSPTGSRGRLTARCCTWPREAVTQWRPSTPDTGNVAVRFPTGWYPSAVATSTDGNRLFIASAKGWGAVRTASTSTARSTRAATTRPTSATCSREHCSRWTCDRSAAPT